MYYGNGEKSEQTCFETEAQGDSEMAYYFCV